MKIYVVSNGYGLHQLRDKWNALAGTMPFRAHEWLATWWQYYGGGNFRHRDLHVVCVEDDKGQLIGIAPWYLDRSLAKGRSIRWLGDGEVCTDHVSLLCSPTDRQEVASALARHLGRDFTDWDLVELEGVDDDDLAVGALLDRMRSDECLIQRREMVSCWAIPLPKSWNDYLLMQSKSHRKQLERLARRSIEAGRCVWHRVINEEELAGAWPLLVDLHQRRWQSVGEPGCFASQAFSDFHRDVAQHMLGRGQLRLSWLELDGAPAAAEYHFGNAHSTYVYQSGLDPDRFDDQPGRIIKLLAVREAIETKQTTFDFLRGNESYKAHWRAEPHGLYRLRIIPPRQAARVRAGAYDAARQVKRMLRNGRNWMWGLGASAVEVS